MTVPLPPQRRHVERITNGPVFTVSYMEDNMCVRNKTQILFKEKLSQSSYHAGAVAEVAVLNFGAWLMAFTITAFAGCFYVNRYLFVDSLCSLSERQLHDVLCWGEERVLEMHHSEHTPIKMTK